MNEKNRGDCVLPASADDVLTLARSDLAVYSVANYRSYELPPFLDLIIRKLEAVEGGEIRRLILSLPPRHGKSLIASTYFPAWFLGRHPDRYVIATSYGQELADDFGRRVRNTIASPLHRAIFPASRMSDDSQAAHRLNMTAGGAYFAIGRGAAITGRGAHLLLIDDPIKDVEEANSPTIRRSVQQWFSSVAFTRLMPGAAIVVIATRWHEDDMIGWLLRDHSADGWQEIRLPAIAEVNDPIGRAEGEALWPERYPIEALKSIRRQLGSAQFASLYQQRPAPIEGNIFRREWWRRYSTPPTALSRVVLSLDTAFKAGTSNDFTAAVVIGEASDGYYILHAWRGRIEFPELKRKAIEFAETWKANAVLIEDKASGQSLIQALRDSTLPIIPVKVDSDKVTRATAITGLVESGRVLLPTSAGWLADFEDELATFPGAAHDDQTDAFVQGLNYLRGHRPSPIFKPLRLDFLEGRRRTWW